MRLELGEAGERVSATLLLARAREFGAGGGRLVNRRESIEQRLVLALGALGRLDLFDQVSAVLADEAKARAAAEDAERKARAAALVAAATEQRKRRARVATVVAAAPTARAKTNKIRKGNKVGLRPGSPSWGLLTRHGLWDAGELRGDLEVTGTHDAGALVDVALADGRAIAGLRAADLERSGEW